MKKLLLIGLAICGAGIFYSPLYELGHLSFQNAMYSHVLLIPVVSLYIFWINRRAIFSEMAYSPYAGAGLMSISLLGIVFQKFGLDFSSPTDTLSLQISCMVIWVLGGFLIVCGWQSFKKAIFPLLFLGFMIPLPSLVLDPVVHFLQVASALSTELILRVANVPAFINGVFISLPGVTVEIAKECSGIRSAMALLILSTFASYIYLRSNKRRLILVLSVLPVTIFKNGMRIATLSILVAYVDMHYLTDSSLHSYGGKPFFVVAILMMAPILWILRKSENKTQKRNEKIKNLQSLGIDMEMSKDIKL